MIGDFRWRWSSYFLVLPCVALFLSSYISCNNLQSSGHIFSSNERFIRSHMFYMIHILACTMLFLGWSSCGSASLNHDTDSGAHSLIDRQTLSFLQAFIGWFILYQLLFSIYKLLSTSINFCWPLTTSANLSPPCSTLVNLSHSE